jgi:hypothetical protein
LIVDLHLQISTLSESLSWSPKGLPNELRNKITVTAKQILWWFLDEMILLCWEIVCVLVLVLTFLPQETASFRFFNGPSRFVSLMLTAGSGSDTMTQLTTANAAANNVTPFSASSSEGLGQTVRQQLLANENNFNTTIFCNVELNCANLEAVGFDMDFTLAQVYCRCLSCV